MNFKRNETKSPFTYIQILLKKFKIQRDVVFLPFQTTESDLNFTQKHPKESKSLVDIMIVSNKAG